MTEYLCLCEPHAARSFHSQKIKWSTGPLVSSEPDCHNNNHSFPSMTGAQKATRSHWGSPQYCMTTQRRSSWPALSESTAAESSSCHENVRNDPGSPAEQNCCWQHLAQRDSTREVDGGGCWSRRGSVAAWEAQRRKFTRSALKSMKILSSCWFLIGATGRGINSS